MRSFASVVLVALLQAGCLAHSLAGIGSDDSHTESYSVAPQEGDARLTCGEKSCTSAPLEQTVKRGRSRGIFWAAFVGETAVGIYGFAAMMSALSAPLGQESISVPGLIAFDLGFTLAIIDLIAFARADDYGPQKDPVRLAQPTIADWRGLRVPLRVTDVVPYAGEPPKTFSVASIAKRAGISSTPLPAAKITHGKVAVLDLKSATKELSADDVRYFGDLVRAATLKAAPQLEVMTRENLLVLLQSSGRDLANCEGECEVDTGRRIGADAIVSGEVLKVGTRYKLTLRLHETHEGKLLGAAVASGRSIDELDDAVGKAAAELFGTGGAQ